MNKEADWRSALGNAVAKVRSGASSVGGTLKDLVPKQFKSTDWSQYVKPEDARNALIGSALGGLVLGGTSLAQDRDPEESKLAPVGDALIGALAGGAMGYGIPKGLELFREEGTGGSVQNPTKWESRFKELLPGSGVDMGGFGASVLGGGAFTGSLLRDYVGAMRRIARDRIGKVDTRAITGGIQSKIDAARRQLKPLTDIVPALRTDAQNQLIDILTHKIDSLQDRLKVFSGDPREALRALASDLDQAKSRLVDAKTLRSGIPEAQAEVAMISRQMKDLETNYNRAGKVNPLDIKRVWMNLRGAAPNREPIFQEGRNSFGARALGRIISNRLRSRGYDLKPGRRLVGKGGKSALLALLPLLWNKANAMYDARKAQQ